MNEAAARDRANEVPSVGDVVLYTYGYNTMPPLAAIVTGIASNGNLYLMTFPVGIPPVFRETGSAAKDPRGCGWMWK